MNNSSSSDHNLFIFNYIYDVFRLLFRTVIEIKVYDFAVIEKIDLCSTTNCQLVNTLQK